MVGGIENEGESMPRTRKSHPPSLKAKVAIEAIKGHKTTAQISQMFGVHPTQVGGWKKQAVAGLPDVFGNGREQMRQQAFRGGGANRPHSQMPHERAPAHHHHHSYLVSECRAVGARPAGRKFRERWLSL